MTEIMYVVAIIIGWEIGKYAVKKIYPKLPSFVTNIVDAIIDVFKEFKAK